MNAIIAAWNAKPLSWLVIAFALIAAPLTYWALTVLFADHLEWLRAQRHKRTRDTYCAELFCIDRPGYTVISHQRTTRRYCWKHAICARAAMVIDGDTGTEVLDAMLERHAERERRELARGVTWARQRPADLPEPRELPTWDRGRLRG